MRKSRIGRLSAAAVTGFVTIAGVVTFASPAWATFVGIKCSSVSGSSATGGTVTLSGCNGNTGGASQAEPVSTLLTGGTITWLNGKTTTFGTPTISSTETDSDVGGTCPAGTSEVQVTGNVTADTTGSAPVPGKYKMEICANSTTMAFKNEPGSKAKIG
jgi:hypothetical protein